MPTTPHWWALASRQLCRCQRKAMKRRARQIHLRASCKCWAINFSKVQIWLHKSISRLKTTTIRLRNEKSSTAARWTRMIKRRRRAMRKTETSRHLAAFSATTKRLICRQPSASSAIVSVQQLCLLKPRSGSTRKSLIRTVKNFP